MIRRNVRIGERPLAPARFPDIRPLEPAVGSFSASQAVPFVALWNWLARRPCLRFGRFGRSCGRRRDRRLVHLRRRVGNECLRRRHGQGVLRGWELAHGDPRTVVALMTRAAWTLANPRAELAGFLFDQLSSLTIPSLQPLRLPLQRTLFLT